MTALKPRHMAVIIGRPNLEANQLQGFETDGDLGREIGDRVATILDKLGSWRPKG